MVLNFEHMCKVSFVIQCNMFRVRVGVGGWDIILPTTQKQNKTAFNSVTKIY